MNRSKETYLYKLFKPGEYINLVTSPKTDVEASDDWEREAIWVCCNPFVPGEHRRSPVSERLAEFRNFVLEFDDITVEEQLELIEGFDIPYATVVFSGNKSLHVVISLTHSIQLDEYRDICYRLKQTFPEADSSCLEPARLTRVPTKGQPLLAVGKMITPDDLYTWLHSIGASKYSLRSRKNYYVGQPQKLTLKSMELLSGQLPPKEAHAAVTHTAKNLSEVGMAYDEIVEIREVNIK